MPTFSFPPMIPLGHRLRCFHQPSFYLTTSQSPYTLSSMYRLAPLLLFAPAAFAQIVGASLSGTVRDESGAILPQTAITVRNTETGSERKLVTDDSGRYSAPSLPIGRYDISASKPGFHSQLKTGVSLAVGQNAAVDLTLSLGEFKQTVIVEESPAALEVSTQETAGLVNERQVKELPLNGRSYDQLMTL